ncbi:MAG: hypothetical protein ACKO96_00565, partial [Flammeovirgaceae bacterium]
MLTKSLGNNKIAIDVEINAEGDADVTLREVYSLYERIENAVDKAQKAQAKANAEAEKAAAIQKGSLTNLQQILKTEEEKLRQIKAGATEYAQQREIVSRL